jgi:hypothetical protein
LSGVGPFMRNLFLFGIAVIAALPAAGQQTAPATPDITAIVERMEQVQAENRANFRPYVVTREFKLFDKDERQSSYVLADITFQPPDRKQYRITQAQGSGSGEKVVRRVLDRETEMTREASQIELSRANYDFALLRAEQHAGRPVYVLELKPKRADKSLLKGTALVDAETFRIYRISGHPAKNPSWLIKDLLLTLTFSDVKGMWMQTASEAVANVRFVGKHVFTSHDVRVRTADQVAQSPRPPAPKRFRPRATASGIGSVLLPR